MTYDSLEENDAHTEIKILKFKNIIIIILLLINACVHFTYKYLFVQIHIVGTKVEKM